MSGTVTAAPVGTSFELAGQEVVVAEGCDQNAGYWICVTHSKTFEHNFAKDSHVSGVAGEHVLAWGCGLHGPEVP